MDGGAVIDAFITNLFTVAFKISWYGSLVAGIIYYGLFCGEWWGWAVAILCALPILTNNWSRFPK